MKTNTILWDVDTQVDFMLPGGKLYVPGAETIIPNLARLTRWAAANRVLVVASADAHQPNDPEFQQYPPHCVAGTPGQKKIPETLLTSAVVIPNRPVEVPSNLADFDQVIIEKQKFDVFTNPNIEDILKQLRRPEQVFVYGVVTEICVGCAVRGLLDRGFKPAVVTDAIRALDETQARALLEEVRQRGGRLVKADDIVKQRAAA